MAVPINRRGPDMVGNLVYKSHSPVQAGKIISVVHPVTEPIINPDGTTRPRYFARVIVRWVDGRETETGTESLNDLTALVEETTRKLKTHTAMLKRAQAL